MTVSHESWIRYRAMHDATVRKIELDMRLIAALSTRVPDAVWNEALDAVEVTEKEAKSA